MGRAVFIVAFVAGVVGGCYLRPVPAPGFRSACEEDADCVALDCSGKTISLAQADQLIQGCDAIEVQDDPSLGVGYRQTCIAGRCEYPCQLLTFADDCPTTEGFQFCFNGACANLCGLADPAGYDLETNDDFCTSPQTCVPFGEGGIDPALFAGGNSGGSGASGGVRIPEGAGFCGLRCDAKDAPPCAPGNYCTGALCLPGCKQPNATPCAAGQDCLEFGGFSACLTLCSDDSNCEDGNVCVPGFGVCQPTCVGLDAVTCLDGFYCDVDLRICMPLGGNSSDSDT